MTWRTTIGAALHQAATRFPSDRALVLPGESRTFRQLDRETSLVARALLVLGIRPGDRVCLWLPNSVEWICLSMAAARIGAVVAPLNTRFRGDDAGDVLRQLDPHTLVLTDRVADTDYLEILRDIVPEIAYRPAAELTSAALPSLRNVVNTGGATLPGVRSYADLAELGQEVSERELAAYEAEVSADDVVHIQYTSGTTARPKGVMHSHATLLRNAAETSSAMGITHDDPIFTAAPLFHSGAFVGCWLGAVLAGTRLVTADHFDPEVSLRLISAESCSIIRGPQTMLVGLADHPARADHDITSLRGGVCGSSTLAARLSVARRLGLYDLITIYGLSEAATAVTMTTVRDPFPDRLESEGRPFPGLEIAVEDQATHAALARGGPGEILVRGWSVMKGYFRMPDETANAVDADGWLHTGDLGRIDDAGNLHFMGRLKDVIRVGGENVSAAEVEDWLDRHPKVSMAQVVAARDDRLGEACAAFVRLHEGETVTAGELVDYCRGSIASFKIPRHVFFVESFPLTGNGKIRKTLLRTWAHERTGATNAATGGTTASTPAH